MAGQGVDILEEGKEGKDREGERVPVAVHKMCQVSSWMNGLQCCTPLFELPCQKIQISFNRHRGRRKGGDLGGSLGCKLVPRKSSLTLVRGLLSNVAQGSQVLQLYPILGIEAILT